MKQLSLDTNKEKAFRRWRIDLLKAFLLDRAKPIARWGGEIDYGGTDPCVRDTDDDFHGGTELGFTQ